MSAETTPPQTPPTEADNAPRNLGLALLIISAAQLMVVLDGSIVNIALPRILNDETLGFDQSSLTWMITGYGIAFGGLLLLGGRIGDLIGRRKVFIAGILVFTLASLLGGLAQSEWQLLAARALQGAGAAAASPTALALITTTFPAGPARNRAFGVYAAMSGAGAAVGLLLGGVLTEASWRWTMLVNVPIGLFVAFLAPRFLTESKPQPGKWDLPGAATATLGLVGIVYGFSHKSQQVSPGRPELNGWTDFWTMGPILAGVALLAAFFVIERRSPHALLPLRILGDRTRAVSFVAMLLVAGSLFSMFYFLGLFIQQVMEYSPVRAGLAFLPFSVGIVAAASLASALANRVDPRWIVVPGAVLGSIGLWGFSRLEPTSTYVSDLLPFIVLQAFGMGLIFVPLTLTAVSRVRAEDSGVGSAVLNTVQQVGGAIALAVLATVFANGFTDAAAKLPNPAVVADPTSAEYAAVQTIATGDAFGVSLFLMVAAGLITLFGLSIKHEDLGTEGASEAAPVAVV
jgi:EmrB/QacA subfamily drug resistance transporter